MPSSIQKIQKTFQKSCVAISMEIKPAMLPFFTAFDVNNEKRTLKPYIAPVNHNHLQETTMLKIVHTLLGNFCQNSDGINDTAALEDMGRDACVMIGCHELGMERVSHLLIFTGFSGTEKYVSKYYLIINHRLHTRNRNEKT